MAPFTNLIKNGYSAISVGSGECWILVSTPRAYQLNGIHTYIQFIERYISLLLLEHSWLMQCVL